jgi:hypothetical protein
MTRKNELVHTREGKRIVHVFPKNALERIHASQESHQDWQKYILVLVLNPRSFPRLSRLDYRNYRVDQPPASQIRQ